jgi:hypothetical protein
MAVPAEEIRAIQQKRADGLATSANEPPPESGAAWLSYTLRWVLIGSVLVVALSVSYYYVIFLPEQERARTALKILELSRTEQRIEKAEKQKEEEARLTAMMQEVCLEEVQERYEKEWAEKCKAVAEVYEKGLQDCFRFFPNRVEWCKNERGKIDAKSNHTRVAQCRAKSPRAPRGPLCQRGLFCSPL